MNLLLIFLPSVRRMSLIETLSIASAGVYLSIPYNPLFCLFQVTPLLSCYHKMLVCSTSRRCQISLLLTRAPWPDLNSNLKMRLWTTCRMRLSHPSYVSLIKVRTNLLKVWNQIKLHFHPTLLLHLAQAVTQEKVAILKRAQQ